MTPPPAAARSRFRSPARADLLFALAAGVAL
jgi:hypothetical protein